jgi:hypothetical protein
MRYTAKWMVAAAVLGLAVCLPASFAADEEKAENPYYKHWAAFKPGTTVVHIEKTTFGDDATDELPGGVDEKIIRYKLLSVSPERAVVEAVVLEREFLSTTESAPTKTIYPAKVSKAHLDAVLLAAGAKFGEDTLKVKVGKEEMEIKCRTIAGTRKKKDEDVQQKFWLSTKVPGGIVKRTRTTKQGGKLVAETTTLLREYKVVD